MYAEAYLPIAVNQTFSYLIPENLAQEIKKGSLVRLPFGNRFSIGYIDNIIENQEYSGKIKSSTLVQSWHSATSVGDESILLSEIAPTWIGSNRINSAK